MNIVAVLKKHRVFATGLLVVFLAVVLALSGLQVSVVPSDEPSRGVVSLRLGDEQVVFTIGTAEAATATDYSCDGIADNVQFQAALDALPATGGKIEVLGGNYNFAATVARVLDDVTIQGVGTGAYFAYNGASAIFSAGAQDHWVFRDFATDSGGVTVSSATNWIMENIKIGGTFYAYRSSSDITGDAWEIPTGRSAAVVIAASDASDAELAQADVICDGTADQVEINTYLVDEYDSVQLTSGTYNLTASIYFTNANQSIFTAGRSTIITTSSAINLITGYALLGTPPNDYSMQGCYIGACVLDGNSETAYRGIYGRYVSRWLIENVEAYGFKYWGIQLSCPKGNNAVVLNCYAHQNGTTSNETYGGGLKIGEAFGNGDQITWNLPYPAVRVIGGAYEGNPVGIKVGATNATYINTVTEGNTYGIVIDIEGAGYEIRALTLDTVYFEANDEDIHIVADIDVAQSYLLAMRTLSWSASGVSVNITGTNTEYVKLFLDDTPTETYDFASANVCIPTY